MCKPFVPCLVVKPCVPGSNLFLDPAFGLSSWLIICLMTRKTPTVDSPSMMKKTGTYSRILWDFLVRAQHVPRVFFLRACSLITILLHGFWLGDIQDKTEIKYTQYRLSRSEELIYIYIYGYWVVSGPHGTAFINCTCMFEGSYIYLPSNHIYQRHS